MNFLNHETQLALRLADPNSCLLLTSVFHNSFDVIIGFTRLFYQWTRFKTQFYAITSLYEGFSKCYSSAGWKLPHVKVSSGATYAVGRRRTRPRAIPLAMTKISRIDGLPFFLTQDAPRAASPPELRYKSILLLTQNNNCHCEIKNACN